MENKAVDVQRPKILEATHLMVPESLNLASFRTTAPPSSSSRISILSQANISTSSLYH